MWQENKNAEIISQLQSVLELMKKGKRNKAQEILENVISDLQNNG